MVTSNVYFRVFHIKYGTSAGTCFTIDIDNKQYFVTAKHVVENIKTGDTVSIFRNKQWLDQKITLIGHSAVADVSVFSLDIIIEGHSMPATIAGLIYGQDLYFLGFPFGMTSEVGAINRDFPLPFVKKATLSMIENGSVLYLDGHNNPGFSGGPVVFKKNDFDEFNVCAIISGYRNELVETKVDNTTTIHVKTNSGIIIAYGINNALDLIKNNPNGKPLV